MPKRPYICKTILNANLHTMAEIQITNPTTSGGGGTVNTGVLQIQGGGPITNSSQVITDQLGNTSPLYISSTALTITTPSSASAITRVIIQGSTDDAGYILRAVNRTGTEIFNIKDDGSVLSTGPLTVSTIANATTDTDKFLVSDGGTLKYSTGSELLSDLGIAGSFVSGGGTATRLAYWSGTVGDSSSALTSSPNLFWDAVNSRLGINTATPTQAIDVTGTTKTTSLILSTATAQSTTATQYLSLDAADSTVKYRTPAQVLSDIGAQAIITNPVTGTGTATRVAFWTSGSEVSSSNLLNWDNTNGRLGIGTASPVAQLQVTGNALAGNNLARFETQGNVNLFTLSEQGFITAFAPQVNPLSGTTEINKFTSSFAAGSAGSGSFRPLSIAYTISNTGAQTGTATGLLLDSFETSLSGMTHNLMELKVGGTSVFQISGNAYALIGRPQTLLTGTSGFSFLTIGSSVTNSVANQNGNVSAIAPAMTFAGANVYFIGNSIYSTSAITNTSVSNRIRGITSILSTSGGGAANDTAAFLGSIALNSTGAVTNAIAFEASISKAGSSTLTNVYGLKINDLANSAGTITNTFGLYVGDITAGAQTNTAYSLYLSDANARAYIAGQTSIGAAAPAATSILDLTSTTHGFLLPRMTTTQRTGISSPANGLMVYDTDLGQPCFYDTVNTRWNKISHSAA
jgi:hypothetical protein